MDTRTLPDLPPILYKYRDWGNEYHQALLTKREVYMSSARQFNDPFDANLPVSYDQLSDDELLKVLMARYRRFELTAGGNRIVNQATRELQRLRDPVYLAELHRRHYEKDADVIGIFSMSQQRNNLLLWAHYANSHRGFIAGFHTVSLVEQISCTITPVDYQSEYPVIIPTADEESTVREMLYRFSTKSSHWDYEREVRLFKVYASGKACTYSPEVLRELVLGAKMPPAHRQELIDIARDFPHVVLYQAHLSRTKFEVDIEPL